MNKKEMLNEIICNLYRHRDALNCIKRYDTHESKCMNYMLSVNVVELASKEMEYILRELERLIADFLPKNDFSKLENNRLLKIIHLDKRPRTVCKWKSSKCFGIFELKLKLRGFDKNTEEYHCLIQAFRSIELPFNGCGYDSRRDEFYITYYYEEG